MKPFNLEYAKACAPVVAVNGSSVRIFAFDFRGDRAVGAVKDSGGEKLVTWDVEGICQTREWCLRMAPLAIIEGREVYVDDVLTWRNNSNSLAAQEFYVTPGWEPLDGCMYAWPKPKCILSDEEISVQLDCVDVHIPPERLQLLRNLANYAVTKSKANETLAPLTNEEIEGILQEHAFDKTKARLVAQAAVTKYRKANA